MNCNLEIVKCSIYQNISSLLFEAVSADEVSWMNNIVLLRSSIWDDARGSFPIELYRYRPSDDRELRTLDQGLVYLSPVECFSDPKDTFPLLDTEMIRHEILNQCSRSNLNNYIQSLEEYGFGQEARQRVLELTGFYNDQLYSQRINEFSECIMASIEQTVKCWRSSLRCACFTETPNSEYMWEEYAASGTGFRVSYLLDNQSIVQECKDGTSCKEDTLLSSLIPVIYGQQADLTKYGHIVAGFFQNDVLPNGIEHLIKLISTMHKLQSFEIEREWRLVAEGPHQGEIPVFARLIPHQIMAGPKCPLDTRRKLADIAGKLSADFKNCGA